MVWWWWIYRSKWWTMAVSFFYPSESKYVQNSTVFAALRMYTYWLFGIKDLRWLYATSMIWLNAKIKWVASTNWLSFVGMLLGPKSHNFYEFPVIDFLGRFDWHDLPQMYYRSVLIAVWTCLIRTCFIRTNSRQILLDSYRQLSSWASWREHVRTMSWFKVFLITVNGAAKYVQNKHQHIAWNASMLFCYKDR